MNVDVRMACTILSVVASAGCALSPALDEQTDVTSADAGVDSVSAESRDAATHVQPRADAGVAESTQAKGNAVASPSVGAGDAGVQSLANEAPQASSSDAGTSAALTTNVVVDAGSSAAPAAASTQASAPASTQAAAPASPQASASAAPTSSCSIPADAALEDVSNPTTVVGNGSASSCTSAAFVAAVANGGVITFNCGSAPVTIVLDATAKVFNDKAQKIVIDGGNKVTLSGAGQHRILYQDTCDQAQVWTTPHCDNQEFPQLTVQNLTFANGNAKGETDPEGGAIYASGGRLKVINSHFVNNACADTGPDNAGGAVYVRQQYNNLPAYVVGSTFGGASSSANSCSNGGALGALGSSYTVINSSFSYNQAVGNGANPAAANTPGGGSGGAIYINGNTINLNVCGSDIEHNHANEGGGGVFFVSDDKSGSLSISSTTWSDNVSGKFENYPGLYFEGSGTPTLSSTTLH